MPRTTSLTLTSRARLSRSGRQSVPPAADGRYPEPFSLAPVLHSRPPARLLFSFRPPEPFCGGSAWADTARLSAYRAVPRPSGQHAVPHGTARLRVSVE